MVTKLTEPDLSPVVKTASVPPMLNTGLEPPETKEAGELVPIPTFPPLEIRMASPEPKVALFTQKAIPFARPP